MYKARPRACTILQINHFNIFFFSHQIMTEMFGAKEDFSCPKYSTADSYIGILSAYNGRIQHSKTARNGDSLVSLLIS